MFRSGPLANIARLVLGLSLLGLPSVAMAEDKKEKSSEKASDKPSKDKKSSGEVRKDPAGQTGISPFMEKLLKGHKLMIARDFKGAVEAYKEAITESAQDSRGHYYMGEAHMLAGDLDAAEQDLQAAVRFAGNNDEFVAKATFLQADIKERKKALDEAKGTWEKYAKFVADHTRANGHPGTPPERQKVIDAELDLQKKYSEVKKRIAARLEEVGKPPPDRPDPNAPKPKK